jgi:nucleotide-binding universal stress UspA family protein
MFTEILVPLDGSTLAEQAIGPAVAIARASSAALDLVLVHDPMTHARFEDATPDPDTVTVEGKYLARIARELVTGAGVRATHSTLRGDPSAQICEQARSVNADLVVMTSHGRTGLSRAWLGSVTRGVLRHASIPVLVIRPSDEGKGRGTTRHLFKRILVTLDGSPPSARILLAAKALARCSEATLVLLQVVQPVPHVTMDLGLGIERSVGADTAATDQLVHQAWRHLGDLASALVAEGIAVETEVVIAEGVARAILECASGLRVDAIAMSTHGRGLSRLFVGSVTDKVLRASDVPMLLERPAQPRTEPLLLDEEAVLAQLPALSGL